MTTSLCRLVVLISGNGSNLQTLIDAQGKGVLPIEIKAVISNRENAYGLERAKAANIPTHVLDHTQFDSREAFDQTLIKHIDPYSPELVVLAGFMRILTSDLVQHYHGRMLNIHPSLLPKYQGLNTHQRVLESGDEIHGVTVHFVTEELDGGPPVIQAIIPIQSDDTEASLAKRVQQQEHIIYPMAVDWFATQRLRMIDNRAELDQETLPPCGYQIDSRHA